MIASDTRRKVIEVLDQTLFVEAGAGSGKTSALVGRFVALVESGIPADRIAAITYTAKAANELVERIRASLEKRAREGKELCGASLSLLDRAAICTVHSFALRILSEHPIEAGLPPRVNVIDEIAADVDFEARWDAYVDQLLDDPDMERPVRLFLASGGTIDHLHAIAVKLNENWDLIAERFEGAATPIPALDVNDVLLGLTEVAEIAQQCTSESDKLFLHITVAVRDFEQCLRQAADDDIKLELLNTARLKCTFGQAANWPGAAVATVRDQLTELQTMCDLLASRYRDLALQSLASSLAGFTLEGAERRRRAGELEFHDLLVFSRAVLRDPVHGPAVRAALAERYQRLLIDEFQDTDPIQVELAVLIASEDSDAGGKDWRSVVPRPGHLFFVGDPKQAIYRFRRADIGTFLDTREQVVGQAETLLHNYRTSERILDWVNATFSELIQEASGSQPAYTNVVSVRDNPAVGPAISFIGTAHDDKPLAAALQEAEARDVAGAINQVLRDQWAVSERQPDNTDSWRQARWSDVAILLPSRGTLPLLLPALEAADVPYRVETSTLVYGTDEVRDLMIIARAVDDVADSLSIVAALRTPAFACGDDDLLVWTQHYGGSWNYLAPAPADAPPEHPVAAGLRRLRDLHEQRVWKSPSEILEAILREGRFFELGVRARRPRDLWRRLRFVLDQCRAWEEAGGITLRQYLRWVDRQSAQDKRAKETILPETDDDAVRILTIHGSKGLEFPIVVMSGMTSGLVHGPRGVEVCFPDTDEWAIRISKDFCTVAYEETEAIEQQRNRDEKIRLLYVATTRARDHLIVSVHRKVAPGSVETPAQVLYDAGWHPQIVELLEITDDELIHEEAPRRRTKTLSDVPTVEEWRLRHDAALDAAGRHIAISATTLFDEERANRGDDEDEPPRRRGTGDGAAIGSAVHAVLQSIDLCSWAGLAEACAREATAEGVGDRVQLVEALCRSALESETIKIAAQRPHWREVYVGIPDGDRVLEGFVDLIYENGEGLAIVDYKTDSWNDESELDEKVERYRVQMAAYVRAVREAVGQAVTSATLLFLSRSGAIARSVGL